MAELWELIPDVEVLLELEPEDLGGSLLQVMNTESERRNTTLTSWPHFLFGVPPARYPRERDAEVFRAIAEAWGWLESQGR